MSDKEMLIMNIASMVVSVVTALFVLYVEIIEARRNRKQDRENELLYTLKDRIDQYSNMTTSVIFAQLTTLYQELSVLLYKNYDNILDLITTSNAKVTIEIDNTYREMCIAIKANSYIFKSELNELLWSYKDMTEAILDCIVNKEKNADYPPTSQIDELYNIYNQIKQYFKTDLQNIQLDISNILKDFMNDYKKLK